MSVKAKVINLWNIVKITWASDEPAGTEIDTTTGGDKTVTVGVGTSMSSLTEKEITNGQDLSGDTDFQGKKFLQIKATLRILSGGTSPTLRGLFVKAYETLASWLSRPASHKIILAEIVVSEELSGGWTSYGGYMSMEDSGSILTEDGAKIVLE